MTTQAIEELILAPSADDRDPLAAVLKFGTRAVRTGLAVGFAVAALLHGWFGGRALLSPVQMRLWAESAREDVHGYLWAAYDVETVTAKPEPPRPEEQQQEERAAPEDAPAARQALPAGAPPPPPAQAGRVLTAPSNPDEPVDLTGNAFVQGDAKEFAGGVTAANGTGTTATYNRAATPGGRPGGTGTGPAAAAPPPPQGPDQSRPPGISGGSWSSCDFPPEADQDQIDYAVVVVLVTVRADGSAMSVKVSADPGHGFGRAARMCALSKRYSPALDREGKPTVGTTPPIHVTFTR